MKNKKILILILIIICFFGTLKAQEVHTTAEPLVFNNDEIITDGDFIVLEDKRIFTMMAFINAIGYDEEYGKEMNEARKIVRRMVNENLKNTSFDISKFRSIYKKQYIGYFYFIQYALNLNNDFPFRQIPSDDELLYGKILLQIYGNVPEILNDFYKNAKLNEVWKTVKPLYDAELQKYDLLKMNNDLKSVCDYLKEKRKDNYVLVMVPNLLDSQYYALGAKYDNYFYSIEGSSTYGLNIHEYLHSYINDLVYSNIDNCRAKFGLYYNVGRSKPMMKSYQYFPGFVAECLVRAIDNRIEKKEQIIIDLEMEGGLLLVEPFFLGLEKFQQQNQPFSEYIEILFNDISELY